jgi:hypothetical protein
MARGPHTFKLCDLTRALKGARAAGIDVARVVIDREGRIVMEMLHGDGEVATQSELDRWMRKKGGLDARSA